MCQHIQNCYPEGNRVSILCQSLSYNQDKSSRSQLLQSEVVSGNTASFTPQNYSFGEKKGTDSKHCGFLIRKADALVLFTLR